MPKTFYLLTGACALVASSLFVACDDEDAAPTADAGTSAEAGASDAAVSGCLEVTDDIRADAVWSRRTRDGGADASDEPDVCVRRDVVVQDGALLVVEPGVRVAFDPGASLVVARADAALTAQGTEELPIVFVGALPAPGSWDGVEIRSADPRNRLEHVSIRGAGGGGAVVADDTLGRAAAALVLNAEPGAPARAEIRHVTIEDSAGWGLVVEWISEAVGLEDNHFARNALGAVVLSPPNVARMDATTTFEGNGFDGVAITGTPNLEVATPTEWRPLAAGAKYWVREPIQILSDLTLAAGVDVIFAAETGLTFPQNQTNTRAAVAILGTAAAKVNLRGEQESAGFWTGLAIETGRPESRIEHAVIADAKKAIRLHKSGAFPPAQLAVSNTELRNNETCGVENTSVDNTLTLTGVVYSGNGTDVCPPN